MRKQGIQALVCTTCDILARSINTYKVDTFAHGRDMINTFHTYDDTYTTVQSGPMYYTVTYNNLLQPVRISRLEYVEV